MLSKRVFLILFLLIIAIGSISAVCAEDTTGDIISNASDDEIGVNDENIVDLSDENVELTDTETDELKSTDGGTFTALQNKINQAGAGGTITLENNYKYTSGDGSTVPTISQSLTINGNGHVIDGNSQSGLLRILGKTKVTLNNIVFQNGYASEVIRIDYVDTVEINKCTFRNNIGYYGGALIITDSATVAFTDCTFTENSGHVGGAAYVNNTEGIAFANCEFNDNFAQYGGAICLLNYNYGYLDGCTIQSNFGNITGGSVYLENGQKTGIKSSKFSKNAGTYGGAISGINVKECTVYYCDFANNYAINGGAIKFERSDDAMVALCTFSNNHAVYGGAIHILEMKGCEINKCDFMSNNADQSDEKGVGGAIYSADSQNVFLVSCDFVKNSANTLSGAVALYNSVDCIIEKCNFTSNKGTYVGGVITMETYAIFHLCNFVKNEANVNEEGIGALYTGKYQDTYRGIVIDCTFSGNKGYQYSDYGYNQFYGVKLSTKQSGSTCDNKVITATLSRLYGGGSVISGQDVTFKVNGKTYNIKTNAKGQAVLKLNLPAKSYQITITHEGSGKYLTNSTKATVVIKKATPKIIASKKTFKQKTRTKAYTITLKNSAGKVMKNTNVKLTVKGKTYSARTNSQGKATFKITKLTSRGSFPATIKFAGNSYYNAVSKKVTISVIR